MKGIIAAVGLTLTITLLASTAGAATQGYIQHWNLDDMTFDGRLKPSSGATQQITHGRLYGVDITTREKMTFLTKMDKVMPGKNGTFAEFADNQYVIMATDGQDVIGELVSAGMARVNGSCTIDICQSWRLRQSRVK